ncbi:nucleotidyltransferase domain-containing protein [Candidatus Woesearchaeota archaeon]|nr:nucleotidyltransferase domain-containing protein [Candidatus Woesearchaeota archaeon]
MIEKSTIGKVLEAFFESPSERFHLRELSRRLGLSMPTIITATDILSKENLILKAKGKVVTEVQANRENARFTQHKRINNMERIYSSGLLEHLIAKYNNPKLVILFGSYSRGEDIEQSDIDIAIITAKRLHIDLAVFEKKLGKKISIHELELGQASNEFKANLANGIVLEGSW